MASTVAWIVFQKTIGFFMRKSSGRGLNSAGFLIEVAAAASKHVPVPDFVTLKANAVQFWTIYSSVRLADEWRDCDLISIAKICNLEADIRECQQMLDRAEPVVLGQKGNPVINPLLNVIDALLKRQMLLLRSLSMAKPAGGTSMSAKVQRLMRAMNEDSDGLLSSSHSNFTD